MMLPVAADLLAGPEEMTRFTGEPLATDVPAGGLWLMTLSLATVSLAAWVTVPTANPAATSRPGR